MLLSRMNLCLFPRQFRCRRARSGDAQRFSQLVQIRSDYGYSVASTRGGDIELLLFHHVAGKNDGVNGLSLAAMCGNGIAMIELSVIRRQSSAVVKLNAASIDTAHFSQFSVRRAEIGLPAISSQQQPVSRGYFNLAALLHGE